MTGTPLGDEDYLRCDATGLAALVRRREVSPAELVETAIGRIERLNPLVNAVIHRMDDAARRGAAAAGAGPFAGVPLLLKDLVSPIAGEPFQCGSRFLRGFVPPHDSELVRRYRAAGFLLLGKTNTPEFGLTPFTEPALCGPTRNPWDLTRTTGGSSGGSGAAVACGMVPVATGGDGGGSIRIPASCCGLFGMKPTRGRVPTGPDFGEIWHGAVVEHVLTRTVRDSAAILDATHGPDPGAPYVAPPPERPFLEEVSRPAGTLRIAFSTAAWLGGTVDPECRAGVEETARLLESLGHEVEEASPVLDGPGFCRAFLTMVCAELRGDIDDAEVALGRRATMRDFEPATWGLSRLGAAIPASEFARAVRLLQRVGRQTAPYFDRYDAVLTPTTSTPSFRIGALQPTPAEAFSLGLLGRLGSGQLFRLAHVLEQSAAKVFQWIPWTPVLNATGQPAMSLPLCWSREGLPIGMHFIGRYGEEATLYRLAAQLEAARPWFGRLAPLTTGTTGS
jgi:amidase